MISSMWAFHHFISKITTCCKCGIADLVNVIASVSDALATRQVQHLGGGGKRDQTVGNGVEGWKAGRLGSCVGLLLTKFLMGQLTEAEADRSERVGLGLLLQCEGMIE